LNATQEDIAPEDLFFFQYFTDQKKNKPKAKKARRGEDDDEDFDLLGEEKELDEDEFARCVTRTKGVLGSGCCRAGDVRRADPRFWGQDAVW
jgi:hypothetical protein